MKKHDLFSSVVWFCMGLLIVLYAPTFDLGTLSEPGSGFMPFVAGIVMCIFSSITFLQALVGQPAGVENIWENIKYSSIRIVLVLLFAYGLLLEKVGFFVCTFCFIFILMRFLGHHKWLSSLFGAGLTSILSYLLFQIALNSQLPRGIFGF